MVDIDLDDLEKYLLDTSFEEVGKAEEPDNFFEDREEAFSENPSESIQRLIASGRLNWVGLPSAANCVTRLEFSGTSFSGISYSWERNYQERVLSDAPNSVSRQFSVSLEELESILQEPTAACIQTSIDSAVKVINSDFEPNSHPLYAELKLMKEQIVEEDNFEEILVIPNLSSVSTNSYAIQDNLDVSQFNSLVPNPALVYPFELDTFQKRAVYRLEQKENVFVAAHTSAGKTVVAEYAIALCKHRLSRVIYTSPIKALSNQKYREFKDTFGNVGILTGDVSVDPDSFCVIMTTEILRSMLYNNSNRLRDLEWVILDEVHYINDQERGVVWEEVLIMLPPYVRIVMLSATVPNYFEFSNWVGRIRKQQVYVQVTYQRPVPLEHSIYIPDEIIPIIDVEGRLDMSRFSELKKQAKQQNQKNNQKNTQKNDKNKKKKTKTEEQCIKDFIIQLRDLDFLPCVMFAFSRDKVDKRGESLYQVNLLTDAEAFKVKKFSERAIHRLNPIDRELPQILFVLNLLSHGIGVHHSGILPILKEIVEILFSKGLIKVLVATETFAMGLNMPTRTVVFGDIRKYDGSEHRYLLAGEYTQMSGRAGRRGKDAKGNVIMFFKDPLSTPGVTVIETVTKSEPRSLQSKFRIRYSQICNVMRSEDLKIEDIVKKSFLENTSIQINQSKIENTIFLQKRMTMLRSNIPDIEPGLVNQYTFMMKEIKDNLVGARSFGKKPVDGSILEVNIKDRNFTGIVVKKTSSQLDCLIIDVDKVLEESKDYADFCTKQVTIHPSEVIAVYRENLPKNKVLGLRNPNYNKQQLAELIDHVLAVRSKCDVLKTSQFINEKISGFDARDNKVQLLMNNHLFFDKYRHKLVTNISEINTIEKQLEEIEELKTTEMFTMNEEIANRTKVLQQYNYVNSNQVVQLKGKVLGATSHHFGLVICESMFRGLWSNLTPQELAGALSVFVCKDKVEVEKDWNTISPALNDALLQIDALNTEIGELEEKMNIQTDADNLIRFGLVEVAYKWSSGEPFIEICKITSIKEGNIVTAILQLSDLVGTIHNSAIIMGDHDMKKKAANLRQLIKRDIVFSTSLYISK